MKVALFGFEAKSSAKIVASLRLRWPDLDAQRLEDAPRLAELQTKAPDLILVLGTSACTVQLVQRIRASCNASLLVLGSSSEDERVQMLEAGADDCVSVRASSSLLVARVSAALRRAKTSAEEVEQPLECGRLRVDPSSYDVRVNGEPIHLTPTEFKLLCHLLKNKGRLVAQESLWAALWGQEGRLYADSLRKYVQRLRDKVEHPTPGQFHIETVPRMGYRLMEI